MGFIQWYNLFSDKLNFTANPRTPVLVSPEFLNQNYSMVDDQSTEIIQDQELSLGARVEALLFVAPEPITPYQISTVLDETVRAIKNILDELDELYLKRGIRLQRHNGKIQLVSAPETAALIETYLELESTSPLSQAALETLSIIAYQQPVTRPQIDSIRGVNSDGVLRTLISKGLVDDVGRAEGPGRPILYSTTTDFLKYFGLSSLDDLPPLNLDEYDNQAVPKVLKG
jgi:segregation and condensation protein B